MGIYDDDPLAHLGPEQVRELFNRAVQDAAAEDQTTKEREAALDFIAAHPEYKACSQNGRVMQAAMDYAGIKPTSFEQIESVYLDLRERGLIDVDAKIVAQQEEEARRQRIARSRGTIQQRGQAALQNPESEAWSMDLNELRAFANEEFSTQDSDFHMPGFDAPRPRRRSGI